jgi:ABC-type uncharacterized transport system substrate-binding protein
MIRRRQFVHLLGFGVVALAARSNLSTAAPPAGKTIRIGLLSAFREKFEPASNPIDRALAESLREYGYEIGRNVVLEFRSARGNPEQLRALAAELVRLKVDVLLTPLSGATMAAYSATQTTPIVTFGVTDPVISGLAKSLAHPGGNVTGLAVNAAEISAKRVQLLKDALPKLSRVAVLWNSSIKAMSVQFEQVEMAAPSLGVAVQSLRVTSSNDFDAAFAAISNARPDGLIVLFGPLRGDDLPRVVQFVTEQRLPTIFEIGQGVRGGGLMEFGPDTAELARGVGAYVDKIANGASPADLPIQEPTKFQLIINLKAARSMGLTIPPSVILRADRVVE